MCKKRFRRRPFTILIISGSAFFWQAEIRGEEMNRKIEFYSTIKELSKCLNISYTKASILANDPDFPKIVFGNKKVFPKALVLEWMNK